MGKRCAYDCRGRKLPDVEALSKKHFLIDVCPEVEGGLSCPRDKHEIIGGSGKDVLSGNAKVVSERGYDSTKNFVRGALAALELAKNNNIRVALLKSKSPSCGKYKVYNGCFGGMLREGSGVTARLLDQNHIRVYTENEIDKIEKD